jgi:lysophospholipase L1-like esterase
VLTGRLRKPLLALLSTIGALVLLEGGARIYEIYRPAMPIRPLPSPGQPDCLPDCMPDAAVLPEQPDGLPSGIPMMSHPTRSWTLPPGAQMVETNVMTRVNAMGLRGPDVPDERKPGEVRLLTLGDSSVFGYGVDEPMVMDRVAASVLRTYWRVPVRGINGGTPGYTSVQALATLREVGPRYRPQWVVIAAIWSDLFQVDRPLDKAVVFRPPSALYRTATRWLGPWLRPRAVGFLDLERGVGTPSADRSARTDTDQYRRTLTELATTARSLGAEPVFLVLPAPIDLDDAPPPSFIQAYRHTMAEVAQEAGAPIIDAPTRFRQDGATNADFYDQIHPSRDGHARLGAMVATAIANAATTRE